MTTTLVALNGLDGWSGVDHGWLTRLLVWMCLYPHALFTRRLYTFVVNGRYGVLLGWSMLMTSCCHSPVAVTVSGELSLLTAASLQPTAVMLYWGLKNRHSDLFFSSPHRTCCMHRRQRS